MKRNLVVQKVGSMLVLRQNAETPTDQEWDGFLGILIDYRQDLPNSKILVLTDGGGPTPDQRKRLERALAGTPVRVAVVSDNLKVRFVASTIALFHRDHRAFSKNEIAQAYGHLGMTPAERRQAETTLREMESQLA